MEPKIIINGQVFFYRQKAPFVYSGHSILGALEYDSSEDKVKCHECGKWFHHVGSHLFPAHRMSAREYKSKHGLRFRSALIAEGVREKLLLGVGAQSIERLLASVNHPLRNESVRRRTSERMLSNNPAKNGRTAEFLNESNQCHAQLLFRLNGLAHKLGRTPSLKDLRDAGISPSSLTNTFNVERVNQVMSLVGLIPNDGFPRTQKKIYTPEVLIELLRDFYSHHGRLPSGTDVRRGLVPYSVMRSRSVGRFENLCESAGLRKVYQDHRSSQKRRAQRASVANRLLSGVA